MTVANGWCLSCLTNVGVEAEEPKLEGQHFREGFTAHVIDVPPLAWLVYCSFTWGKSSAPCAPLACCVPVGVFLQQRSAHQNVRVSAVDFAIPLKNQVLNMISEYLMSQTADTPPNALVQSVDLNVVVQKRMRNLNVEWVRVREPGGLVREG